MERHSNTLEIKNYAASDKVKVTSLQSPNNEKHSRTYSDL